MTRFDRLDICEAHYLLELEWNSSGWLQERPSNTRRMEATHVQLERIHFKPALNLGWEELSDNARNIYLDAAISFGLIKSSTDLCFECGEWKDSQGCACEGDEE